MTETMTTVWPGQSYPRGAAWDGAGVNFALFTEHAEGVDLCLFDTVGRRERQRIRLQEQTGQVWHCYLPEARPGMLYGYRVSGSYQPLQGHRLIDPFARLVEVPGTGASEDDEARCLNNLSLTPVR